MARSPDDLPVPDLPKEPFGRPPRLPRRGIAIIVVVCGLLLLILAIGPLRPLYMGYIINVSIPLPSGAGMAGSFRIDPRFLGLRSDRTGGACLVADIASLVSPADAADKGINRGTCQIDSDCNPQGEQQKWGGYCVASKDKPSRCWYKPVEGGDGKLCRKSPVDPWPISQDIRMPADRAPATVDPAHAAFNVHAFYQRYTAGRSADWRIIGCLNGKPFACGDPKPNSDRQIRYGDPVRIP